MANNNKPRKQKTQGATIAVRIVVIILSLLMVASAVAMIISGCESCIAEHDHDHESTPSTNSTKAPTSSSGKADAEDRKTERRRRISEEAAKQCGRGIIPEVYPTLSYEAMLQDAAKADLVLFCYEAEGTVSLRSLLGEKMPAISLETSPTIAIIVGSEGGFSPEEAEAARKRDFCMVGLGKRILRCETAPPFVLACLSYQYEL